ncbi:MAG: tetraacyldisaccharide 4'-kinase [Acidobacteriaceae bacterium]
MSARRGWAWPVVPLYWTGLRAKDALRAAGVLRVQRLNWPVVSVGSLSAGGAGKTPVVIALAKMLKERGWAVDVLSRGYGRAGRSVERVGLSLPDRALQFGDEPVLIAETAGIPVWVGESRFAAGTAAERIGSRQEAVHLLDDGFQHRQLARAVDVVLVSSEDLEDALLPAGNRREPLSALRRADIVVVSEEDRARVEPTFRQLANPAASVWSIQRTLTLSAELDRASTPCLAFCGIARPDGFFAMLREQGLILAAEITFPDHHRYTIGDVSRLVESCHLGGGGAFVTTEKDAVKIGPEMRAALEAAGRLHVARLEVTFADPEDMMRVLEARLR